MKKKKGIPQKVACLQQAVWSSPPLEKVEEGKEEEQHYDLEIRRHRKCAQSPVRQHPASSAYDSPDSHTDSSLFARECWLFQHICFISQRLVGHGKRSFRHALGVVQKLFEEEKGDTTKGCVFAASCLVIPSHIPWPIWPCLWPTLQRPSGRAREGTVAPSTSRRCCSHRCLSEQSGAAECVSINHVVCYIALKVD